MPPKMPKWFLADVWFRQCIGYEWDKKKSKQFYNKYRKLKIWLYVLQVPWLLNLGKLECVFVPFHWFQISVFLRTGTVRLILQARLTDIVFMRSFAISQMFWWQYMFFRNKCDWQNRSRLWKHTFLRCSVLLGMSSSWILCNQEPADGG